MQFYFIWTSGHRSCWFCILDIHGCFWPGVIGYVHGFVAQRQKSLLPVLTAHLPSSCTRRFLYTFLWIFGRSLS